MSDKERRALTADIIKYLKEQGPVGALPHHTLLARALAELTLVLTAPNLRPVLEQAYNGLRWYRDAHPEDDSGADDEMFAQIDAALDATKDGQ